MTQKAIVLTTDEAAWSAPFIRARALADMTQEQVAERMGTTKAVIVRLERGRMNPSIKTLQRYAKATGTKLRIHFESIADQPPHTPAV